MTDALSGAAVVVVNALKGTESVPRSAVPGSENIPPSPGKTVDIRRKYLSSFYQVNLCPQYKLCDIHCLRSCSVIDVNAVSIVVSISKSEDSRSLIPLFTLEKASSIGLRSGEYGGKKCNIAPVSSITFIDMVN